MSNTTTAATRPTLISVATEIEAAGVTFERVTTVDPANVVRVWQATVANRHIVLTEDVLDYAYGRVVWEVIMPTGYVTLNGTVWAGRGQHANVDAVDALHTAARTAVEALLG